MQILLTITSVCTASQVTIISEFTFRKITTLLRSLIPRLYFTFIQLLESPVISDCSMESYYVALHLRLIHTISHLQFKDKFEVLQRVVMICQPLKTLDRKSFVHMLRTKSSVQSKICRCILMSRWLLRITRFFSLRDAMMYSNVCTEHLCFLKIWMAT